MPIGMHMLLHKEELKMSGKRFYIPTELYNRLERLAKIHDESVDEYAARLLNTWITAREGSA